MSCTFHVFLQSSYSYLPLGISLSPSKLLALQRHALPASIYPSAFPFKSPPNPVPTPTLESNEKKYSNHHLSLLLLGFRPPTAPPYARGSTVLYPLSLLLSSLTLFFLRGGLCSSITTTSSLPPLLRLRLLSRLTSSLLSSTMIRSTGGGGLTIRTGLLSLRTSTVSDTRRDLVDPPR
jgi:hypothetical protein